MNATKESIEQTARDLGLSLEADFVPLSQSRNAKEKFPTLNWKVRLLKNGRVILEADYSAGCAHCPSYKQGDKTVIRDEAVRLECERGKPSQIMAHGVHTNVGKPFIMPSFADVLYSLASDAGAIDCASFEDWADEFGYDKDSRKAEAAYRACLDIGLKLRNALGNAGYTTLLESVLTSQTQ